MTNQFPMGLIVDPQNSKLIEKLVKLENYDFSLITNSCITKYKWDEEYAYQIEKWTKQFFSFAFLDNGYYHIPESDVDEYWHRMILHTSWYHEFCQEFFGVYYHHMPHIDSSHISEENRNRSKKLIEYWYGINVNKLIDTCTQCNSPVIDAKVNSKFKNFLPNINSLPSLN